MRILQLCNKPPLPAIDGGCLAMHSITEGLLDAGHEVMVFAIVTPKHPLVKEKIPADYFSKTKFESEFIDTTVKAGAAVINLFSGSSLNVDRFYSSGAEQKIKNILVKNAFDIVILESIYMSPYIDVIRKNSKAKIVLRSHNVEHLLWEDRARTGKDLLKRKWFSSLAKKMKSAEVYALNNTDAFLAITTDDQKILSSFTPKSSITIPFALKFEGHDSIAKMYKKTVFHIGAMDWLPNIQGVQWFIDNVWPLVLEKDPAAEFHIAGKSLEKNDRSFSGPHIFNHGEVENASQFSSKFSIMVVPLQSGSGLKIKIVEGLSKGKVIVTTPVGAEGTGIVNGVHALIANEATGMANAIVSLMKDEERFNSVSHAAKRLAEQDYELKIVTKKMTDFFGTLAQ